MPPPRSGPAPPRSGPALPRSLGADDAMSGPTAPPPRSTPVGEAMSNGSGAVARSGGAAIGPARSGGELIEQSADRNASERGPAPSFRCDQSAPNESELRQGGGVVGLA